MARKIAIGSQSFSDIIENKCFFIDKTPLIKDWWENYDSVTLITRPRRFGKTLNMDMINCFFSNKYIITEIEKEFSGTATFPKINESLYQKEINAHFDTEIPYTYVTYTKIK
jgi:hypothetical protein